MANKLLPLPFIPGAIDTLNVINYRYDNLLKSNETC